MSASPHRPVPAPRTIGIAALTVLALTVSLVADPALAARRHRGSRSAAPATPAAPAPSATTPTPIGQFGDWQAYQVGSGRSHSCFVISSPKDRKPASLKRDPATFFVSSRPGEGVRNELSVISGFAMRDGADASLKVGTTSYALYVKGTNAWVKNTGEDATILAAMRRSRSAVFEGSSTRGNKSVDTYSLSGLPQALEAMRKACS